MTGIREEQEISVLGRLCTIEALILFMGFVSMIYGMVTGNWTKAVTGAIVVAAALGLLEISKRWCKGCDPRGEKRKE